MNRVVLSIGCGLALVSPCEPAGAKVIHEQESLYHYLLVEQTGSVRTLKFRRAGWSYDESAVDMNDPLRLVLSYSRLMFAGFLFQPHPKTLLMVGLGAGTCPRVMSHYFPELRLDVIELDPAVKQVAEKYFGFHETRRVKVMIGDGRVQIRRLAAKKKTYDLIMLDAFGGGFIPAHLTTKEFLEECRSLLTPAGVLVSNLWPSLPMYERERRTMARVFPRQYGFGRTGNKIVVCLQSRRAYSKDELRAVARQIMTERKLSFDLVREVVDQCDRRPDFAPRGPILVDDHNPANLRLPRK